MKQRKSNVRKKPHHTPDMEETKMHVMAAGREILLAAQGALSFCETYVETCMPPESRTNLIRFFKNAISVADELGRGITGVSSIKKAAEGMIKPVLSEMNKEMKCCGKKHKCHSHVARKKHKK